MSALDDMAARLVAYGGVGTVAAPAPTIFVGRSPSTPDQCVTLREHPGGMGVYTMGRGLAPVVTPHSIQATVRAVTYDAAEALAWKVYAALNNWEGTVNGTEYLHVVARHTPVPFGEDEQRRAIFICNFVAQRKSR